MGIHALPIRLLQVLVQGLVQWQSCKFSPRRGSIASYLKWKVRMEMANIDDLDMFTKVQKSLDSPLFIGKS